MVFILSENKDYFTDKVIEWLRFYGIHDIVRINADDRVRIHKIEVHQNIIILNVNDKLVDLGSVKLFWYRRSTLNHPFLYMIDSYPLEINQQVNNFSNHEWTVCRNYIIYMLQQKKPIGNYFVATANKLINLRIAQECGLDIPRTYISDFPKYLNKLGEYPSITKPISEAML
ncbi:MAG: hypothetical protein QM654_18235 [Dysgonamonadaceae bacterium]